MLELVEQHREAIAGLCRKYGVSRLELFGSAARGDFDPAASDLDFLVDFEDRGWRGSSTRYFGLLHDLEDMFGRHVDLVVRKAVENPLFLEVAEQFKEVLYAA